MKSICAIFILLLLANSSIAQQEKQQDKKATKILNDVSKKYKSYKTLKAQFSLTLENTAEKIKDVQTGIVYLKKDKFKVEINGQEIICDGKTMWTYAKDVDEVQVSKFDANDAAINPSEIFTMYEKGFLYKFVEEKNEGGKVMQYIELTPKDKKKSFFKVKLKIDKIAMQIVSSKIFDKNGNTYTYEIRNLTPNVTLADGFFVFNIKAHPGISVINLDPK